MNRQTIIALSILALVMGLCDTFLLPDITPTPAFPQVTVTQPLQTPSPSSTSTPRPTAAIPLTPTPTYTSTPLSSDVWITPSDALVHPDGGLYSGDQVSFQVRVHNGSTDVSHVPIEITLPNSRRLDTTIDSIAAQSVGQASFEWVWNTTGLSGTFPVTVTVDPRGTLSAADVITTDNTAAITVTLRPASELPAEERGARWATQETACCRFHYITHTAAERDLKQIMSTADDAVAFAETKFGEKRRAKLDIYLVDRVLGQGGFASDLITISYLDRNYAAGDLALILRHETTHVLNRQLAGNLHTMIAEGLAVWVAGGHYKPEPLDERAAALLELHEYIPLRQLAHDLYSHQHESGYLEAASLVKYLIERDGLDTFKRFLQTLGHQHGDDAKALDQALHQTYSQGLDALEREWLDHLRAITVSPRQRDDVAMTIAYYETVRRYEQTLDPSAYFRQVWLPDVRRAESLNIVADWVRHPDTDENAALETLLIAAHDAQLDEDWTTARQMLASVNAVLDANEAFRDPIATQYLALVRAARAAGWEPQRITLSHNTAAIVGIRAGGQPTTLTFTLTSDGWRAR